MNWIWGWKASNNWPIGFFWWVSLLNEHNRFENMRQQCRGMELEKKPCEPRRFRTWNFYQFCVLINFHDNRNNNVGKCREFSPPKLPLIELCSLEFAGNFGAHLRDFHLPQGSGHSQPTACRKIGWIGKGILVHSCCKCWCGVLIFCFWENVEMTHEPRGESKMTHEAFIGVCRNTSFS